MNKIFVIEGTDGSGKQTQTQKLYERLIHDGKKVLKTSFPNYDNQSSGPVKEYLSGNISQNPHDISPKAASLFYAVDRYISYKENIEKYYNDNETIILFDRYVSSNLLHQGGKILQQTNDYTELDKFITWLHEREFKDLSLPEPSLVFFLHIPVEYTMKLMKERKNKFTQNDKKDIHEIDENHVYNAINSGLYVAKQLGWCIIECVKDGKLRSIEDINDEIYNHINVFFK